MVGWNSGNKPKKQNADEKDLLRLFIGIFYRKAVNRT